MNGDDVSSDHFSFIIKFKDLPIANKYAKKEEVIIWNTKKAGGWEKYKELMEACDEFDYINDDQNMSSTEAFARIIKLQNIIKYKAFGKVKFKKVKPDKNVQKMYDERNKAIADINNGILDSEALNSIDDSIAKEIIATQRKELVSEIECINKIKETKGKMGAIFEVKNKILGNKKKPEREATAVINFKTKELEVSPQKIREISLDYVSNLLENDQPDDDVKDDVALTRKIHILTQLCDTKEEDFRGTSPR